MPEASPVVPVGIVGLSLLMLVAWPVLTWKATGDRKLSLNFAAGLVAWSSIWLGLAFSGRLADLSRKPPLFVLLPPLLVTATVLLVRSRIGKGLAAQTPLWILIGVQGFRLPLEWVMHQAAAERVMPVQMTFGPGGFNYDIVTGVTALMLAAALRVGSVPRPVLMLWNVIGSVLLCIVVGIAVVSTPLFAKFGTEPEQLNTWVLHAPYVWLPAVLVGSALLGHLVIFKRLFAK